MTVRPLSYVYQVFAGDACEDEGNCAHKKEGMLKVTVLDDNDCPPVLPVLDDILVEVRYERCRGGYLCIWYVVRCCGPVDGTVVGNNVACCVVPNLGRQLWKHNVSFAREHYSRIWVY